MSAEASHEHRERLLLELVRALLALAGEDVVVSVVGTGGAEPLLLRAKLTCPFRQPLDPDVLTLGFDGEGLRVDLHLRTLADLRRWDFRAINEHEVGVVLVLTDGTIVEIERRPEPVRPDTPRPEGRDAP